MMMMTHTFIKNSQDRGYLVKVIVTPIHRTYFTSVLIMVLCSRTIPKVSIQSIENVFIAKLLVIL